MKRQGHVNSVVYFAFACVVFMLLAIMAYFGIGATFAALSAVCGVLGVVGWRYVRQRDKKEQNNAW